MFKLEFKNHLKMQVTEHDDMAELRKLIRLTPLTFAVTIPTKYLKALELVRGDYIEISLIDLKTLGVRRHLRPVKQ